MIVRPILAVVFAVLAAAASLSGCGREDEAARSRHEVEVEETRQERRPDPVRLATNADIRDDPSRDGWPTEAAAKRVSSTLGELAHALASKSRDVPSFVADDFRTSTRLVAAKPLPLDRFFRVDQVLRSAELRSGRDACGELLDEITSLCGGPPRSKFKVLRVELDGTRCETRIRAEFSRGSTQLQGHADLVWAVDDEAVLLKRFDFTDLERVVVRKRAFVDVTAKALSDSPEAADQFAHGTSHWLGRIQTSLGVDILGHSGIAVGDVDGDGRDDLFVSQPGGLPNRLLVATEDGRFRDVSRTAGVDVLDRTTCTLIVDLDDDGDRELVMATRRGLLVFANDGTGTFRRASTLGSSPSWSLTAADFDGDGDLDIFAPAYFSSARSADAFPSPNPFHEARNGGRNVLWRNDGALRFSDVTGPAGLDRDNSRFTFAAAWEDFDLDGDQDLLVVNDFGANQLFRNDDGRFVDVGPSTGAADSNFGMSASWGDPNRDGHPDIYVSNMFSSAGHRIVPQPQFKPDSALRSEYHALSRGNTLLENDGDGSFTDVTNDRGVAMGRWAWGSRFVDVDNDGWEDILVANGYVSAPETGDL